MASCVVCGAPIRGRADQRTCGSRCRQKAYRDRRRQAALAGPSARQPPKSETVYQCPRCEVRLLGEQRCEECGVFCRRLGPGGPCPHCDEPVALGDLTGSG